MGIKWGYIDDKGTCGYSTGKANKKQAGAMIKKIQSTNKNKMPENDTAVQKAKVVST